MSSARFATPFSVTLQGSLQLAAILSLAGTDISEDEASLYRQANPAGYILS